MKKILFNVSFLFCFCLQGQDLKSIKTSKDAQEYLVSNKLLDSNFFYIASAVDTAERFQKFYKKKQGAIWSDNNYTYKAIESKKTTAYRFSYIYIDANKFTSQQLDSLGKKIILEYKNGIPISELRSMYTSNRNDPGEHGWMSEEFLLNEFVDALRIHKKGDIFSVQVKDRFFIVWKTHNEKPQIEMNILRIDKTKK